MEKNIRDTFHRVYRGAKNFMTPNIIEYGRKGAYIYELSKGESWNNSIIYGLTFLENGKKVQELNTCCHSMQEVKHYLNKI